MEEMIINNVTDSPVGIAFIVHGCFYVYDTYNNQILKLNKEQYIEVTKLFKFGLKAYQETDSKCKAYSDIDHMIAKGYFRKPWVSTIAHAESELLDDIVERGIQHLTLQVTRDCNFICRYCAYACETDYNRSHDKVTMTWDVARRSIDFLFEHSKDSLVVNIGFYGGEPLLNFSLIKRCVEYAKELFKSKVITFNMTTNGYILTNNIIDFLAENSFVLSVSLDGPSKIQNYNRKVRISGQETFDTVWNNVKNMRDRKPQWFDNHVYFHPVYLPGESPDEIRTFYSSHAIKSNHVSLKYANLSGVDYFNLQRAEGSNKNKIDDDFSNTVYDEFCKLLDSRQSIPSKWQHNGPCVPGGRKIFVDVSGNIYPCEKLNSSNANVMGNIDSGIDKNIARSFLNIGLLSADRCKQCFAMRFCNICLQKCYDHTSDSINDKQKCIYCERMQHNTLKNLRKYVGECVR